MRKSSQFRMQLIMFTLIPVFCMSPGKVLADMQQPTNEEKANQLAKYRFLVENKKIAEIEWKKEQDAEIALKIKMEEKQQEEDRKRIQRLERKKEKLKKEAVKQTKQQLVSVRKDASNGVKQTRKLISMEKKKEVSDKNESKERNFTADAVTYNIGSAGNSAWKSFEYATSPDGGSAFNSSSDQYRLQLKAYTGKYGIRMVDGRYCAAIASRFGKKVGTKFDVVLSSGNRIKCIMGDQKADKDTDASNSYHLSDGSYLEFIVDRRAFNKNARLHGNAGKIPELSGKIKQIIVYR